VGEGACHYTSGRLYLSGVSDEMHHQFARTDKLHLDGPVRIYEATPVLGEATHRAYEDAQARLVGSSKEGRTCLRHGRGHR
jgi:SulP family sulfate permease